MFFSCLDQPSHKTKVNNKHLNTLSSQYAFISSLGSGVTALTIKISNDTHHIALKMMKANADAFREVSLSSKINTLINESEIYNTIHGWIICRGIPNDWKDRIQESDYRKCELLKNAVLNNEKILFLAMELNTHKITEVGLSETDIVLGTFLLLHGIAVGRKRFPFFRHRDIHPGNVMVMLRTNPTDIIVKMISNSEEQYRVPDVLYLPKLIDFGEARFEKKPHSFDVPEESFESFEDDENSSFKPRNDILRLRELILDLLALRSIENINISTFFFGVDYDNAIKAERDDYESIETLLRDQIFQQYDISLIEKQEQKRRRTLKCQICTIDIDCDSKMKEYDDTIYAFCGDVCETRFQTFRKYLRKTN